MDLSWVILICGAATLILALVFVFFGYKLARFLMPICGVLVALAVLWAFALPALRLDVLATWLFMGGAGISVYILLFFFKRISGFFVGLTGSALLMTFIVYALGLSSVPYINPICLTLCAVSGLLAIVYRRNAVIAFTAMTGACVAMYAGLYLLIAGVNPGAFDAGVLPQLSAFLSAQKYLVAGASLVLMVIGILVQGAVTSKSQVLPGPEQGQRESASKSTGRRLEWLSDDSSDTDDPTGMDL